MQGTFSGFYILKCAPGICKSISKVVGEAITYKRISMDEAQSKLKSMHFSDEKVSSFKFMI
jgi:hypothetical protein